VPVRTEENIVVAGIGGELLEVVTFPIYLAGTIAMLGVQIATRVAGTLVVLVKWFCTGVYRLVLAVIVLLETLTVIVEGSNSMMRQSIIIAPIFVEPAQTGRKD
jgi:hypothetical protein